MDVVVLNRWVTETNDTSCVSNSSTSFAKSANEQRRRSTLWTTINYGDTGPPDLTEVARQTPYIERLIGTLRRDCLDHVLSLANGICGGC